MTRSLGFLSLVVALGALALGAASIEELSVLVAVVSALIAIGAIYRAIKGDEDIGATMLAVVALVVAAVTVAANG